MENENTLNTKNNKEEVVTSGCKTPEKKEKPKDEVNGSKELTPPKEQSKIELDIFKTPEKSAQNGESYRNQVGGDVINYNKTPEKTCKNSDLKSEVKTESELVEPNDEDDGLISTTEQARLLIAACKTPSKTPSKSTFKTPVKNNTPNGKNSVENSPYTPGKHKRADLITLSSPKAKRLKQV